MNGNTLSGFFITATKADRNEKFNFNELKRS